MLLKMEPMHPLHLAMQIYALELLIVEVASH